MFADILLRNCWRSVTKVMSLEFFSYACNCALRFLLTYFMFYQIYVLWVRLFLLLHLLLINGKVIYIIVLLCSEGVVFSIMCCTYDSGRCKLIQNFMKMPRSLRNWLCLRSSLNCTHQIRRLWKPPSIYCSLIMAVPSS